MVSLSLSTGEIILLQDGNPELTPINPSNEEPDTKSKKTHLNPVTLVFIR